ncbi:alpha/beta hydrolase [Hoeflea sp. CAU 1731]
MGVDNPRTSVTGVSGAIKKTVYIATSRARADDPNILFTGERHVEGVQYAKVDIYIPPNHKPGYVERPKSVPPDPKNEFVILNPIVFPNKQAFRDDLDKALAGRSLKDRHSMLFVHGFNTDFVASVSRAAQIAYDSGFSGIPVVFSWASRGKTLDYVYDLNSALIARDDLVTTANVVVSTRTTGMDVIAHSMGNLLTVEAMRQGEITNAFNTTEKLENIILASPDIDADLFAKQMQPFAKSQRRFYVLISSDDKALSISRRISGGVDRVGNEPAEELSKLGVTVIDLSKIKDTSSLDHTKFADSPEIVQLIGERINEGDTIGDARTSMIGNVPAAAKVLTGSGSGGAIVVFN